ncbi:hypothetical protein EJ110_NYTH19279 [Nymphaea thermarum]|nr:hypothetical protein EJ110_NYTH19279 [Nymphaea thermarum]
MVCSQRAPPLRWLPTLAPHLHPRYQCDPNASQARHHSLDSTDHRWPAEEGDVQRRPNQKAGGSADVGVEDGEGGDDVGGVGGTAVEAAPTQPQQPCPGKHQQHIVRWKPLPVTLHPRPDLLGGGEAGGARGEVNDVAAGVVDNAPLTVGTDGVGEDEPEGDEGHPRSYVHPPQHSPGQQYHRQRRIHVLEQHHRRHGVEGQGRRRNQYITVVNDGGRQPRPVGEVALRQGGASLAPEWQQRLPKGKAVAEKHPEDEAGGEGVEGHEGGVDRPFLLDDAGVEDNEARHALQPDERCRHHLPGVVALVEPFRHGGLELTVGKGNGCIAAHGPDGRCGL